MKQNQSVRAASLQLGAGEGGSLRMHERESIRGVRSPLKWLEMRLELTCMPRVVKLTYFQQRKSGVLK